MKTRKCPVSVCPEQIPTGYAFCRKHWFALPKGMRDNIWALFRESPGSAEHLEALDEARQLLERTPLEQAKEDLEAVVRRQRRREAED